MAMMKRFGNMLGLMFMGSLLAGCGGGIPTGPPAEMPTSSASDQFKNMMKTAGPKMQAKGKWKKKQGSGAPTAESTKSDP
jgi:hypothetical protein